MGGEAWVTVVVLEVAVLVAAVLELLMAAVSMAAVPMAAVPMVAVRMVAVRSVLLAEARAKAVASRAAWLPPAVRLGAWPLATLDRLGLIHRWARSPIQCHWIQKMPLGR